MCFRESSFYHLRIHRTTRRSLACERVRTHRTAIDLADEIKCLVDVSYPDVETMTSVLDNLNPHIISSLYSAFLPAEAQRISRHLEVNYRPIHGRWLNIAKIELIVIDQTMFESQN